MSTFVEGLMNLNSETTESFLQEEDAGWTATNDNDSSSMTFKTPNDGRQLVLGLYFPVQDDKYTPITLPLVSIPIQYYLRDKFIVLLPSSPNFG